MRTITLHFLGALIVLLAGTFQRTFSQIPAENTVWKFSCGPIHTGCTTNDTAAFVGSFDKYFYAINLSNGHAYWRYRAPDYIASNPTLQDTIVCFESRNKLFGLSVTTGQMLWSFVDRENAPNPNWTGPTKYHHSSPVINNNIVYYGDEWGNMNGVDLHTGSLRFQVNIGEGSDNAIRCNPAISGDTIYFGNYKGDLYAVSLTDSSVLWKRDIYAPHEDLSNDVYRGSVVSEIILKDNKLYFGGFNNSFSPVNRFTGQEIWHFTDGDTYLPSTPLLFGERIILGTTIFSHKIHCLNTLNGSKVWSKSIDGIFFTQPIIIENSVLVMNSSDPFDDGNGKLYFIDAIHGKMLHELNLPSATESSPIWFNGDLLLGGNNGFYRIDYQSFIEGYIPENIQTQTGAIHYDIPYEMELNLQFEISNGSARADTISSTCAPVAFSMQGIELNEYSNTRIEGFGKLYYGIHIDAYTVSPDDYSFTFTTVDVSHADTFHYENTISITILQPSSFDDINAFKPPMVYPNPFQHELNIDLSEIPEGNRELSVFNSSGQLQFLKDYPSGSKHLFWNGENTLGIELNPGIYYYRLKLPGEEWSGRVIKN